MVAEGLDHEAPLSLPSSTDPVVGPAMAYTRSRLDSATAADVSRAVGVSERTLRRRFHAVVGQSWRSYLLRARAFAYHCGETPSSYRSRVAGTG